MMSELARERGLNCGVAHGGELTRDVGTRMNRLEYQSDPTVCDFVIWVTPFVTGDQVLKHG